mmetsp:Transcript_11008/g.32846  ORF Transcript_11008/g.32846 Transcript_11008/m.32846 type:complete len:224 (+) Transcript_11008:1144-1815(+)
MMMRPVVSSSVSLTKVLPSAKRSWRCQMRWRTRPSNVSHLGPPASFTLLPSTTPWSHRRESGSRGAIWRRSMPPAASKAAVTSSFARPWPSARSATRPHEASLLPKDTAWPQVQPAASWDSSTRSRPRFTAPWPLHVCESSCSTTREPEYAIMATASSTRRLSAAVPRQTSANAASLSAGPAAGAPSSTCSSMDATFRGSGPRFRLLAMGPEFGATRPSQPQK